MTRYSVQPRDRIFVESYLDFCYSLKMWVEISEKI